MTYCTDRQIAFIASLAAKAGFNSSIAASDAYGFGLVSAPSLSGRQASELIDWLIVKTGGEVKARPVVIAVPAPAAKPALNKGGRVGLTGYRATNRGSIFTIVNDNGKRVHVLYSDGSKACIDPSLVIFSA